MGAATQGRIELARLLVDSRAKLDAVDHDGSTALMFAVRSGESEFAKFLIDKGANVNAKDAHGNTVLDILLMSQNPSVTTDLLLKAGAKPNQYIRTMITRCATDVQERAANAFSAGSGGSLNSTREFILGKLQEFQKSRLFDADFVNLARTSFVAALTDALRLQQVRRTSTRTDGDRQVDMKFAELMEEILEAPRAFTTALLSAKSSIAAKDWVRAGDQIDQALALQPDDPEILRLHEATKESVAEARFNSGVTRAQQHFKENHYALAVQASEEALRIKPDEATARKLLDDAKAAWPLEEQFKEALARSVSMLKQKKWTDARRAAEDAQRIKPGDERVARVKKRIDEWESYFR